MENRMEQLREECLQCQKCPLAATRHHVVFGTGKTDAEVVFVGEGPGENEDLQGEPFVGRGGALLDKYLEAVAGRICGNGASESCSSTDCTDSGQFLFRYFRWPSSGVRICIPDIFIHDGRDGVNVIRLEYQTGKIRIT